MAGSAMAQVSVGAVDQSRGTYEDAFRQFEGEGWPSPNDYRTASGAPGYRYWQQQVDYDHILVPAADAEKAMAALASIAGND